MFQIDLTTSGELCLHLPTGRTIEISATPTGILFIKKIVYEHQQGIRNQPGYIGTLPTQHAVNKFLAGKKDRIEKEKADEVKAKASKLNIDWDKLEISI